ncbi:hypothetical protein N7524_001111, partial [Penicillium chrysogenum]
ISRKHSRSVSHRISYNESIDPNFPNLPIPTPKLLKLFVEFYIKSCKKLIITSLALRRSRSEKLLNPFLRKLRTTTELIVEYKLPIKPRERFLVNGKDIAYLLRHLFIDNYYNYIYKRARVIVYRVADSAFIGLATITEVLTIKLPNGREL